MILGDEQHSISTQDVIYIAPETAHQFHADKSEPLGFICVVDPYRDRPTLPNESYIDEHICKVSIRKEIKCRFINIFL